MSRMIEVRWDTSEIVVDEEEFELIKMMLQEAGFVGDAPLKSCLVVIENLEKQGYDKTEARRLAHMATGSLRGLASTRPV